MNLLDGGNIFVGWQWQWDVSDDDTEEPEDSTGSELELERSEGEVSEEYGSDDGGLTHGDEFFSSLVTHTVMFKCIGVTREVDYQSTLCEANTSLRNNEDVPVRLTPEPNNLYDSQAIAFECQLKDKKWRRIGYVVREALEEMHRALNNGDILSVRFGWIKFIADWYMSGPGYFAGIKISKRGDWPASVVRCGSTRLQ